MKEKKMYQPHEFARIVGLTKRALRYYNEQGILLPDYVDDRGYKYYTEENFFQVQQILSLRFLQFSIEDIKEIAETHRDVKISIKLQKEMLREKVQQIRGIIETLDHVDQALEKSDEISWEEIFSAVKYAKCQMVYGKMMAYYDERAKEYDEIYEGKGPASFTEADIYSEDVREIEELTKDFGKGNAIDIGCGSGYWTKFYMAKCQQVTFLDQSSKMLEMCQKKVAELGFTDKARFIHDDFFQFDFREEAIYDIAVVGFVVGHFSKVKESQFFDKLKKHLRVGSQLLIIENTWNEGRARTRNKEDISERKLNNGKQFEIYKRYFEENEFEVLLKQYGFMIEKMYYGKTFAAIIGRLI